MKAAKSTPLASPVPCVWVLSIGAHLDRIYYGNNREDAAKIGFDDNFIYKEIAAHPHERMRPMKPMLPEEAIRAFELWEEKTDKTEY